MKPKRHCEICGRTVSKPHTEGCSNKLRNCQFKKKARREAKEGKK